MSGAKMRGARAGWSTAEAGQKQKQRGGRADFVLFGPRLASPGLAPYLSHPPMMCPTAAVSFPVLACAARRPTTPASTTETRNTTKKRHRASLARVLYEQRARGGPCAHELGHVRGPHSERRGLRKLGATPQGGRPLCCCRALRRTQRISMDFRNSDLLNTIFNIIRSNRLQLIRNKTISQGQ